MNYLQVPPRSSDSWRISLIHPHIQTNIFRFRCANCLHIQDIHLTTIVQEELPKFIEAHKNCPPAESEFTSSNFSRNIERIMK